jgi:hypothetical protein
MTTRGRYEDGPHEGNLVSAPHDVIWGTGGVASPFVNLVIR